MTLDARDSSILTQVAFKAAVDLTVAAGEEVLQADDNLWDRFEILKTRLFTEVESSISANRPSSTVPTPQRGAEQAITEEFGATPHIEVVSKGGQQGPFPAWFLKAAAERGTTKVYDNRDTLATNPNRPWFKDADNKDNKTNGFWPPKSQ